VIDHGRLNVDTVGLVTSLQFDINDNGDDTVTVTLDGLDPASAYYRKQRKLLSDVARLERH
jgi:hypothetical protein